MKIGIKFKHNNAGYDYVGSANNYITKKEIECGVELMSDYGDILMISEAFDSNKRRFVVGDIVKDRSETKYVVKYEDGFYIENIEMPHLTMGFFELKKHGLLQLLKII